MIAMFRRPRRPSLAQFLLAYEADRAPIIVSATRMKGIVARLIEMLPDDLDPSDGAAVAAAVAAYTSARFELGRSAATIRRELAALRSALRDAWRRGEINQAPSVMAPPQTIGRQRWLTPPEARALLHHVRPESWLATRIMLMTGCRLGAACDLTWDRVDLALGVIDLRTPASDPYRRRRKGRAVAPIPAPLLADLKAAPRMADRVVQIHPSTVCRHVREAAQEAGLGHVTPHILRHTAATWLIGLAGMPIVDASRLLGHRDTAITETIYAHVAPSHLTRASDALAGLLTG